MGSGEARLRRSCALALAAAALAGLLPATLAPSLAGGDAPQRLPASSAAGGSPASGSPSGSSGPSGATGSTGSAAAIAALRAHLGYEMGLAGSQSGAYVYDLTTQQVLFSERAAALHPPASVEKLYTSTATLARMGPETRLKTTVYGVGHLAAGGVWHGNLYLRGQGDPTFGSRAFIRGHYSGLGASVQTLASGLVRDGVRRMIGRIEGDEGFLDGRRGEPSSGYGFDPYLEGVLSGLAFNRGAEGSHRGPHAPAEEAAQELAAALRADHVTIRGPIGAATTPAHATALAQVSSPTVAQLLGIMLPPSDNFFAEMLLKDLGAAFGGAGSTAAGAGVVRQTLAGLLGVQPRIVDGSGLSREDLTSPEQVVRLLTYLDTNPLGTNVRNALAVAGRSGTLADRMVASPATGRCRAKTGTLTGVSNLAGYCESASGDLVAFAFFDDGISIEGARTIQDNMGITIARY
jgi:D-alanyl-D-alanine carboxypeptidase/D-alanyl-D-alanine-endopeptidase (penicillin-binding protein 4)